MHKSSERNESISTDDKLLYSNIPSDKDNIIIADKEKIAGELIHIKDVNSRDIFKNNILVSQFLRDYSGINFFANIRPEDIEDQTSRFKLHLGIEVEGDTVKKIHVKLDDIEEDIYVISLIEHKSRVDYDVAMQLLRYMIVIWDEYAKERNRERKNASKAKHFRYPLIIPIVYYEGTDKWTAGMQLSDRIAHFELAKEYVPDFSYKIVPLGDYKNQELIEQDNEMSLIMMINKIQGAEDFHEFRLTALEHLKSIYEQTSTDIQNLLLHVIWGLLMKINIPEEKATDMLINVKEGKDVGILFENFQEFDWKGEKRMRKEAEAKAEEAEAKASEAQAKAAEAEAKASEAQAKAAEAEAKASEAQAKRLEAEAKRLEAENAVIELNKQIQQLKDQLSNAIR